MGEIKKISTAEQNKMLHKSVMSLPNNPSTHGYTAMEIKKKFIEAVLGVDENDPNCLVGTINRIVDETNQALQEINKSGVLQSGDGNGSIVRSSYTEGTGEIVSSTATGEGAIALGVKAEANGLRSTVFGVETKATEDAIDSAVFGQQTTAEGSGDLSGGLRSKNKGHYSAQWGVDCEIGKNVNAFNFGTDNIIGGKNKYGDGGYFARGALGTGLKANYDKVAIGQFNEDVSDAIVEFGAGKSKANRKTAFDVAPSGAIRQYSTKHYIKKRAGQPNGTVVIDTDAIPAGGYAIVQLPTQSGTLARKEDLEGLVAPATADKLGAVKVGSNLEISDDGVLSVLTVDNAEEDNTKPITSAGAYVIMGNVDVLLKTI
ncbi:MAG: hypothetical protein IJ981_03130 [Clostridia bacterium]|nr:hypothetical protein [Clostridia bacterium]